MRSLWLVAVTCALAGAVACSRGGDEARDSTVIAVTTAAAEPGTIAAIIQTAGVIAPAPEAQQIVTATEPARIVELPKAEGETVFKGDVLVRFEFASQVADAERDVANVTAAQGRLESARAAQTRAKELFDRGLTPRMNVDNAQNQITAADAELQVARAAAAEAEAGRASRSAVRAAFDGVVERRLKEVGDAVDGAMTLVLVVVDPNRLEVSASMPYGEAKRLNIGNAARVLTAEGAPGAALKVVARPDSPADAITPVTVRLAFDAPPAMPVGLPVQLGVVAEVHEGATLVPLAAVVYEGDATSVFVVNNGKAQRVAVTVGITDAAHAEITSGVEPGTIVAIDSEGDLFDGAKVTVR